LGSLSDASVSRLARVANPTRLGERLHQLDRERRVVAFRGLHPGETVRSDVDAGAGFEPHERTALRVVCAWLTIAASPSL